MKFNVVEAKRELIWAKIACLGASGSGKSYSMLKLATGMLDEIVAKGLPAGNGKIAMLSTEGSRGRYYANEFKYDIVDLTAPHNPEMYVEAIEFIEKLGYPICILDSSSPEWEGTGGCLELHQQAGGTFQSWGKVTPRHDKFIQAIANSQMHMLVTMRGKDQYEVEKAEGSKPTVKKLGVGAQQRNGFEYEFTATFSLDKTFATSQKDNTHLFENLGAFRIDEKHGTALIDWANSGEGYTPMVKNIAKPEEANLKPIIVSMVKNGGEGTKEIWNKHVTNKEAWSAMKDPAAIKALYDELTEYSESNKNVEGE